MCVCVCVCVCVGIGDLDIDDLIANLPPKDKFPDFQMEPAEFEKVRSNATTQFVDILLI